MMWHIFSGLALVLVVYTDSLKDEKEVTGRSSGKKTVKEPLQIKEGPEEVILRGNK